MDVSYNPVPVLDEPNEPSIPIFIRKESNPRIPEVRSESIPISLNSPTPISTSLPIMPSIERLVKVYTFKLPNILIMTDPEKGVHISDRNHMFIKYENCFVGNIIYSIIY